MGKYTLKLFLLRFLIIAIASTSILIGGHVLKDYRSKQLVLTSVYDAIKNSVRQDMQKAFNRNEMNHDSRNKRNTKGIDKPMVYYDNHPGESQSEYSFVSAPLSSEIVCTRRGDYSTSTKVTEIHDNPQQNNHLTVAIAFKYGLLLLAALLLPVILFKMFILPMAILTSLKMISLVNSFLLGSLLLKYKWAHAQALEHAANAHGNNGGHGTTGNGVHTGPGVIHPTGPVRPTGPTGMGGVRPTALGNRIELGDDGEDYVDITEPGGEDYERVIKLEKKKKTKTRPKIKTKAKTS